MLNFILGYSLNINTKDYKLAQEKRDRAVQYWKQKVILEYLPPIDQKKRQEINDRITKMANHEKHLDTFANA